MVIVLWKTHLESMIKFEGSFEFGGHEFILMRPRIGWSFLNSVITLGARVYSDFLCHKYLWSTFIYWHCPRCPSYTILTQIGISRPHFSPEFLDICSEISHLIHTCLKLNLWPSSPNVYLCSRFHSKEYYQKLREDHCIVMKG